MATFRLAVSTTKKLAEAVSEALFQAGAQGLEERLGRHVELVTYGESRKSLSELWRRAQKLLAATAPAPVAAIEEADDGWKTAWTEHLRPVQLTRRLVLAPTTVGAPALTASQQLIVYQPALAFGDGDHPTTRLASRAIERHYAAAPGGALLDIGAGTGVLSFVAVLSGAARALGIDSDAEAVRAAQSNAQLNGLEKRTRFVAVGARVSGSFDLVVVNIELRPLLEVIASLPTAARRAPRLLATGILKSQVAEVTAALRATGFRVRRRASEQDWVLLDAERQ
jgi:ribosomal protein L11 methyltransferase